MEATPTFPFPLLPEEEAKKQFAQVKCFSSPTECKGTGNLFITTKRMLWYESSLPEPIVFTFLQLVMHGVCRSAESFSVPAVFCELDVEMGDSEEEECPPTHYWFAPEDSTQVDAIFSLMSECSALNPDPSDECDGAEEMFFCAEDFEAPEEEKGKRLSSTLGDVMEEPRKMPRADTEEDEAVFADPEEEEEATITTTTQ
eukprot:gnl/Trimastix_PCT/1514.p1 GENE.gnl/Trimastix_PCT/1514~~gnl/Trimastix_PCT/1514.p1  ORF type:complete len:221 (-),score=40.76 gnl/Trimastix_PCT/1514:15-614(-)